MIICYIFICVFCTNVIREIVGGKSQCIVRFAEVYLLTEIYAAF